MKGNDFLRWFAESGAGMIWRGLLVIVLACGIAVYGAQVLQRTAGLFERPSAQETSAAGTPSTEGEAVTPSPTPQPTATATPVPPTETPSPTPIPTPHAVVGADGVNVRSGPDTTNELLGFLDPNTRVPIIGRDGDWWQISYNGAPGWVFSQLVTAVNAEQVVGTATPTP